MTKGREIVTSCARIAARGEKVCLGHCAMEEAGSVFSVARVGASDPLPPEDDATIDVAILDMNHGWPNLGHNSIVHAVREAACDFESALLAGGLRVRAISFDVRRSGRVPEPPGGRFSIYVGTGGPGHIDPSLNDGVAEFSQGIREDASWEPRAHALFDAALRDEETAFIAVCHSFGVLCHWSGAAKPARRGPEKGGKSAGIVENVLTDEGARHPWFSRFAERLNGSERRFRMIDSRLFDLIPTTEHVNEFVPLSFETVSVGGAPGDALTGVEFARDKGGVMPRFFGVNHHPEIMDRDRQLLVLERQYRTGEVTKEWYEERYAVVARTHEGPEIDQQLALTSGFTFVWPLRFYLLRQARKRAFRLARPFPLHEDELVAL